MKRNNPNDFGPSQNGLANLSRLLFLLKKTDAAKDKIDEIIDGIVTPVWLGNCFKTANTFSLIAAMMALAGYQSPRVIARFWCAKLDDRLAIASRSLRTAQGCPLSVHIRFLAAGALFGRLTSMSRLSEESLLRICRLPIDVLPHMDGAIEVDGWRRELWLGLRLLASADVGGLVIDPAFVQETCEFWHANMAATSDAPSSTPHRINQSMVRWLSACVSDGTGRLLHDDEPLWLLNGFPNNPSQFRFPST